MKPLKIKTLRLLMISSIAISGCASSPKAKKLQLKWTFFEIPPTKTMACLGENDVKQLREALIECGKIND